MKSCSIELGNITEIVTNGEAIQTLVYRTVFGWKKSIRSSEFYNAANVGLKPELTFVVWSFEFANDERLKYNNKVYTILRVYNTGEKTELTVAAQVGGEI